MYPLSLTKLRARQGSSQGQSVRQLRHQPQPLQLVLAYVVDTHHQQQQLVLACVVDTHHQQQQHQPVLA